MNKSKHKTGTLDNRTEAARICVVGLGYVGLPLACAFDEAGHTVWGVDVDPDTIETLELGVDPTGDVGDSTVATSDIEFATDGAVISNAEYVIVAVPTPVDDLKNPNLQFVEAAAKTIGEHITEETIVVLESTVYPGATREILAPAIESVSGLEHGTDFLVGYSPERMVPGDDEHGLRDVVKIVSGDNDRVLDELGELYETIIDAGVHRAPEIEVAEAAKAIENIQRDVNIALINELAVACHNLGLETQDVLEAAGTKWNFHEYQPGLVGGHCIPVDPFFMIYESERNGFTPKLIETGREVNEYMPEHVAELMLRGLNDCGKVLQESTVVVLGLAYKPDVGDIRTSVVDETIEKLQSYDVDVIGVDPHADMSVAREEFDIEVQKQPIFDDIDGMLLATPHEPFLEIDYVAKASDMAEDPVLVDVDNVLSGEKISTSQIEYRTL